jgi:hypothetical protein
MIKTRPTRELRSQDLTDAGMRLTPEQDELWRQLLLSDRSKRLYAKSLITMPLSDPACQVHGCDCYGQCTPLYQQVNGQKLPIAVPALGEVIAEVGHYDIDDISSYIDYYNEAPRFVLMGLDWGSIKAYLFKVDMSPYYDSVEGNMVAFVELPAWSVHPVTEDVAEIIQGLIVKNIEASSLQTYLRLLNLEATGSEEYLCADCQSLPQELGDAEYISDQVTRLVNECVKHQAASLGMNWPYNEDSVPVLNLNCDFDDPDLSDFYSDVVDYVHYNWQVAKQLDFPDYPLAQRIGDPWSLDSLQPLPLRPCGFTNASLRQAQRLVSSMRSGEPFRLLPLSLRA